MTSRKGLSLVAENRVSGQRDTGRGQMSLPAQIPHLGPLRRAMRATPRPPVLPPCPEAVRRRLAEGWPRLMLAKFRDDAGCAAFFGRTRQAASYWRSGHCKPDGPALALAWLHWPEDCRAMFGGVR